MRSAALRDVMPRKQVCDPTCQAKPATVASPVKATAPLTSTHSDALGGTATSIAANAHRFRVGFPTDHADIPV
jgi:hypothetical protein